MYTLYPIIAAPLSLTGGFHAIVIDDSVAASRVGAALGGSGNSAQTRYYVTDSIDVPMAFVAVILTA